MIGNKTNTSLLIGILLCSTIAGCIGTEDEETEPLGELVVAFENTYGLPSLITHTMNVFGERQNPEKYIPMVIKKVRDSEKVTVHANSEKTVAGSRHYIHAEDVADALMFLFNYNIESLKQDSTGAKCQKFNIVGKDEIDNLQLAQFIAQTQKKELITQPIYILGVFARLESWLLSLSQLTELPGVV